ncbi:MAG TPA: hypothetical protein VFN77_11375 [Acetobacteraceae bacterium]|nr:hypothetical protein [Acetobacteraceae bacterium]
MGNHSGMTQTGQTQESLADVARRISARRGMRWHRRPLSPGVRILLWSLRLYVFLMLAVVAIQVTRLIR